MLIPFKYLQYLCIWVFRVVQSAKYFLFDCNKLLTQVCIACILSHIFTLSLSLIPLTPHLRYGNSQQEKNVYINFIVFYSILLKLPDAAAVSNDFYMWNHSIIQHYLWTAFCAYRKLLLESCASYLHTHMWECLYVKNLQKNKEV